MSKESLRKEIADELLESLDKREKDNIGDAARIINESAKVRQCLVLNTAALADLQKGFEAAINTPLKGGQITKYRNEISAHFHSKSQKFTMGTDPKNKTAAYYFRQLVRRGGLTWGTKSKRGTIVYIPQSFDWIKKENHRFNIEWYKEVLGGKEKEYNKDKVFGKTTQFDHGAQGWASSLQGATMGIGKHASKNKKRLGTGGFEEKLKTRIDASNNNALSQLSARAKHQLVQDIMKLILNWNQYISADGTLKFDFSMIVTPIDAKVNMERAAFEKELMEIVTDVYWEWVNKGKKIEDIEGSSSLREKFEKHIVYDKFLGKLAKMPGVTVTTPIKKNTKLRTKTKVNSTNKGKSTGRINVGKAATIKGASRTKAPRKNQQSLFNVMAMINQKLPQTVDKNMGVPRLESQTGRFSQSVRITEATTTNQGYPSFGYTYQKNPYQVYESGKGRAPWADGHRDPRQLIDASIRELAAHLALGRFYTRRV